MFNVIRVRFPKLCVLIELIWFRVWHSRSTFYWLVWPHKTNWKPNAFQESNCSSVSSFSWHMSRNPIQLPSSFTSECVFVIDLLEYKRCAKFSSHKLINNFYAKQKCCDFVENEILLFQRKVAEDGTNPRTNKRLLVCFGRVEAIKQKSICFKPFDLPPPAKYFFWSIFIRLRCTLFHRPGEDAQKQKTNETQKQTNWQQKVK